ncbi:flavodoxin domain-containing protein [Clostridium brassicae]|uniref:Flavodoxin domain-containing protein n=1 Tax=Clostridium brassicae TaxID=2999072 RepID=A0ABT4D7K7_9CLOT|nr:flavodoxin domain-containing protein [Clostridium brassicae]MCY6957231.1 flavodoxin domain-containing protein [Clostridium brassicae]
MNNLIIYATKYGCTEKCAEILSEKLMGKVDLCNLKVEKVPELLQYDKIIIGGSIYAGKIQKEVSEFCLKNICMLKDRKVGFFICGMLKGDKAKMQINDCFPQELLINAVVTESFGGEFRFDKMNFMERFIIKMISKKDKSIPRLNINKNVSDILDENINRFVDTMNKSM